jgi:hypothetical protein
VERSLLPRINIFLSIFYFFTIYLLRDQKLNYINYFEHEINMSNFVQATHHDANMYANIK